MRNLAQRLARALAFPVHYGLAMHNNNFATIDGAELEAVTGGTDWGKVWDSTKQGASDYGMGGALLGAAVGTAAPGVGTLTGAGAGGLAGTVVGGAWGAGKELYNQWGSGQ